MGPCSTTVEEHRRLQLGQIFLDDSYRCPEDSWGSCRGHCGSFIIHNLTDLTVFLTSTLECRLSFGERYPLISSCHTRPDHGTQPSTEQRDLLAKTVTKSASWVTQADRAPLSLSHSCQVAQLLLQSQLQYLLQCVNPQAAVW